MRPIVATLLEALGALIAAGLIVGVALLLFGCSRPADYAPPVAAPVVAPNGDTDDCPGGVCHVPGYVPPPPKR